MNEHLSLNFIYIALRNFEVAILYKKMVT